MSAPRGVRLAEAGREAKAAALPLAAALSDQNCCVRWYAAEALGKMGANAAPQVNSLVKALENPDPVTRRRAAESLGRIADSAKPAIARLAENCRKMTKISPSAMPHRRR